MDGRRIHRIQQLVSVSFFFFSWWKPMEIKSSFSLCCSENHMSQSKSLPRARSLLLFLLSCVMSRENKNQVLRCNKWKLVSELQGNTEVSNWTTVTDSLCLKPWSVLLEINESEDRWSCPVLRGKSQICLRQQIESRLSWFLLRRMILYWLQDLQTLHHPSTCAAAAWFTVFIRVHPCFNGAFCRFIITLIYTCTFYSWV